MDTKTFFENFETIADAPGGIARLRELILDLAVRGKLVEQDSNIDATEIDWDVESLRLDEQKLWGQDSVDVLPDHWLRIPMAALGRWGSGGTPTRGNKSYYGGSIPWLVIGDLNDGLLMSAENHITEKGLRESSATLVPVGAVFVAMYGSIGKSGIAGIECATNQAIAHCVPNQEIVSSEYLFRFVLAIRTKLFSQARGLAQQNISQTILKHLIVAMPPLEEQKRIVAKVDDLMALCDQLESAQQQRDSLRTSARNSAIDAISTASTPEELNAAWKRINLNWITFADSPESISSLRSLVLDLAIQGLLTNSDLSAWSESNLGDVVEIIRGVTFPASAKQRSPMKGLIPCLRTANVQNEVDWDDLLYISEEYVRKESQIVMKDDILISMANSRELVGKVALVKRDDLRCTLGGFIAALRCSEAILPEFLMSILRVPSARDKLIDSSTQTTNIANISIGRLKPFEIRIPPVEVQKRIVAKVDELMTLCDELENHLRIRNEAQLQLCRAVTSSVAA